MKLELVELVELVVLLVLLVLLVLVVLVVLLSVVDEVLLESPPSLPPQPTANTSSVAPPNTASRVLAWEVMSHQSVAGCPASTRAFPARNSLESGRGSLGVRLRVASSCVPGRVMWCGAVPILFRPVA